MKFAVGFQLYENGEEPIAAHIQKNKAVITLDTKDVYTALELLENFATGDDIMAQERRHALIFTPQAEGEKTTPSVSVCLFYLVFYLIYIK